MDKFFAEVDKAVPASIDLLRAAVSIPSISADPANRPDVVRMAGFLAEQLENLGCSTVEQRALGKQPDKPDLDLPPIVLAQYGEDEGKKTILVYGHYDVQPALKDDGWNTDPFTLTIDEETGRMYGRGSTDDKGPVLGWICALQAYKKAGIEVPVNIKFCLEGMEEYGSEGLDDLIREEKDKFFNGVDAVCISDNYWLGTTKPCLTYGLRGVSYFNITIAGPAADLHSGVFGGTVHEPLTDLSHIFASLVLPNGTITIPGIMDQVAPLTDSERSLYQNLTFSMHELESALGSQTQICEGVEETLMRRWRYPSLSLHGIEGAFSASGAKTVIPAKVQGKFSIRTVPDMEPDHLTSLVKNHVNAVFEGLGSKNTCSVTCLHEGRPWVASPDHWNYRAASTAVQSVFGVSPDLTREGGSIPVTLTFEQELGVNVLLLPMGRNDDGAHSVNEKLDRGNYVEGIKLLGAYLWEVARVET
ncbi:putative glutamate carboxypeptidase [Saitoella complicata NRRL Y-17804]|nr:putative glutamate carboxypeptidase [Saitoella complicata NRRL Y-17804]ODQ54680.1 putative glutamate carboxypeptidase [Saitoella complicata NRRL Y-17804]